MREIKFRSWNVVDKTMYNSIYNCKDSFEMQLKHPQIYKIMQYTGLKDKNGKEIYEGDILNYGTYGNYKVVYNKSSFKIQKVDFSNGNVHLLEDCYLDEIEVIGNVYENPKLLGE